MLVAVFGAIVLAGIPVDQGGTAGLAVLAGNAAGFARVFLAAAACLSVALALLFLLKEKPLQTDVAADV
jgi:biotin transporter BioY